MTARDRGQAFTLEGVVAALLLLASVAFAVQATAVTSRTATTANEHVEGQLSRLASGALDAAAADGALRPSVLHWDTAESAFHGARRTAYSTGAPPTRFGDHLSRTFAGREVAYNVNLYYVGDDGDRERVRMVHRGAPSDDAARATALVTLYGDDPVYGPSGDPTATTVENASFYAPDARGGPVYNVVRVEVIAWRI